jgi:hypothetical protein
MRNPYRARRTPRRPQTTHRSRPAPRRAAAPRGFWVSPPDYDGDYSITADEVFERPRTVQVQETGVLDGRGWMICRVSIPIQQRIGFGHRSDAPQPTAETVVSADELYSIPGALRAFHAGEVDDDQDDDEDDDD